LFFNIRHAVFGGTGGHIIQKGETEMEKHEKAWLPLIVAFVIMGAVWFVKKDTLGPYPFYLCPSFLVILAVLCVGCLILEQQPKHYE